MSAAQGASRLAGNPPRGLEFLEARRMEVPIAGIAWSPDGLQIAMHEATASRRVVVGPTVGVDSDHAPWVSPGDVTGFAWRSYSTILLADTSGIAHEWDLLGMRSFDGRNPVGSHIRNQFELGLRGDIRIAAPKLRKSEFANHFGAVSAEYAGTFEYSAGGSPMAGDRHVLPSTIRHASFGRGMTAMTVAGEFGVRVLGETETILTRLPAMCARWIGTPTLKSRCVLGTPSGIYSWSAQGGVTRVLGGLEAPCDRMSFSHDERHFVSIGGGMLRVWDWGKRSVAAEASAAGVTWAEFSPTEPVLAVVEDDGRTLSMWRFVPERLEVGGGVSRVRKGRKAGKEPEGMTAPEEEAVMRKSGARKDSRTSGGDGDDSAKNIRVSPEANRPIAPIQTVSFTENASPDLATTGGASRGMSEPIGDGVKLNSSVKKDARKWVKFGGHAPKPNSVPEGIPAESGAREDSRTSGSLTIGTRSGGVEIGEGAKRESRTTDEVDAKQELRSTVEAGSKQELHSTGAHSNAAENVPAEVLTVDILSTKPGEIEYSDDEASGSTVESRSPVSEALGVASSGGDSSGVADERARAHVITELLRRCTGTTRGAIRFAAELARELKGRLVNTSLLVCGLARYGQLRNAPTTARWLWEYLAAESRVPASKSLIEILNLEERFSIKSLPTATSASLRGARFTANALAALERATEIAFRTTGSRRIHTRHLVASLLTLDGRETEASAHALLREAGFSLTRMRTNLYSAIKRFELESDDLGAWNLILMAGIALRAPGVARIDPDVIDESATLTDHLDLATEVNALAAVMAAKKLEPPISIGLFGDWGSGKSYFMKLLQQRIDALSEGAKNEERQGRGSAFRTEIAHIRFNAWHYIDADLWASLAAHIFEELARHVGIGVVRSALSEAEDRVVKMLSAARHAEARANERSLAATTAFETARVRLEEAEAEASAKRGALDQLSPRLLLTVALADPAVSGKLNDAAKLLHLDRVPSTMADLEASLRDAQDVWARVKRYWRSIAPGAGWRSRIMVVGGTVLLAAAPFATWGLIAYAGKDIEVASKQVIQILGWITTAAGGIRLGTGRVRKGVEALEAARDRAISARDARSTQMVEQLREELSRTEREKTAAEEGMRVAVKQVEEANKAEAKLRSGRGIEAFLLETVEGGEYSKRLGLVARLHRDFKELTRLLSVHPAGGRDGSRRVDRIILYIDDLDRCPTKRVVEVLQAVHLLLAFKLFVVVVAVDSRWLLHALEEEYSAFGERHRGSDEGRQRGGDGDSDDREEAAWRTTPQNYLEKIFHIPYTLRRMGEDGFKTLVEDLMPAGDGREEADGAGDSGRNEDEGRGGGVEESRIADGDRGKREGVGASDEVRVENPVPGRVENPPHTEGGSVETPVSERGIEVRQPLDVEEVVDANSGSDVEASSTPDETAQEVEMNSGEAPERVAVGANSLEPGAETEGDAQGEKEKTPPPDMNPPALVIHPWELEFMKSLSGFVPTPRAAKRVVNVYRLIKACVSSGELAEFEGTADVGGGYQAVMLLLAVQNGFPRQAAKLMRALMKDERMTVGEWWTFVESLRPALALKRTRKSEAKKSGVNTAGPAQTAGEPWKNSLDAQIDASEAATWERLVGLLERVRMGGRFTVGEGTEFSRRAGLVGRFSYQWRDAEFGER